MLVLEGELREVGNRMQEERRKRITMKKNFGEAMEKMEEMMGRMMEELMREMIDHMTDEKVKNMWEAVTKTQMHGLPQNKIGEITDRATESTRVKKRTRLEVEEF